MADEPNRSGEFAHLSEANRRVWDANARWWDDEIGDGNDFQDKLIEPATERLLDIKEGDVILDIACGAGRVSRRMAELGAQVVAFDYSHNFIERAKERSKEASDSIEFHLLDAADESQLLALGSNRFDAAVCTMALMDIPAIEPLMRALGQLLKPKARFVFSVAHPCFHSAGIQRFREMYEEDTGRHVYRTGVKISSYLTPSAKKTEGIIGQPEPQYYFHRPLHLLLEAGFRAGFVVDAMEEPCFQSKADTEGSLRWLDIPDIPPVLVVRMRLDKEN